MKWLLIVWLLSSQSLAPDDFSKMAIQARLDELNSDEERIEYIVDNFYKIYSNDLETAIHFTDVARQLAVQQNLKIQEASCLQNLGVANYLRGNYETALTSFLKCAQIVDSLDYKKGIASLNNEMAVFYNKQNELDRAYACLDRSEQAALEIGDSAALSTTYHHRGTFLSRRAEYEKAKPYFDKVLAMRNALRDSVGLGYVLLDMAEYELFKKNLASAIDFIEQSTKIRELIGDRQGMAVNQVIIGETYFNSGEYQKAIPYFQKGIEIAKPMGFSDLVRFAYNMLQECYQRSGNYKSAYENLRLSKQLSDSLLNTEKAKAIAELQTKYETEKKEQKIQLQESQIAQKESALQISRIILVSLVLFVILASIIGLLFYNRLRLKQEKLLEQEKAKTREAQIAAALNSQEIERRRFARDLHDGFGQMISVLNLNLKSLEKADADRHIVFENSGRVLDEMYKELKAICFNLMPETLIKSGVIAALREFANRINASGRIAIQLHTHNMEERLADIQEINLYRITQEWVNNILKYSSADSITIQLTRDEIEVTLVIEDSGMGFKKELLTEGMGNGWKNINSRVNLLKGELELDTLPGRRGNTFILNIPIILQPIEAKRENKLSME